LISIPNYSNGQSNEAIEYYENALMKKLGEDYAGAIADFKKYIELLGTKNAEDSSTVAHIYVEMAQIEEDYLRNYAEAFNFCMLAVELDKEYQEQSEELLFYRAIAKLHLKDFKGAIKDLDKTQTMGSATFYKGIATFKAGNKKKGCLLIDQFLNMQFGGCSDEILKEYEAEYVLYEFSVFSEVRENCPCN